MKMVIRVARKFNLGNYENVEFEFQQEHDGDPIQGALELAKICQIAYEAYNIRVRNWKKFVEEEAQRIASMIGVAKENEKK